MPKQCKLHITGKTVAAKFIFFSTFFHIAIFDAANVRKKHRSMEFPYRGISGPYIFSTVFYAFKRVDFSSHCVQNRFKAAVLKCDCHTLSIADTQEFYYIKGMYEIELQARVKDHRAVSDIR